MRFRFYYKSRDFIARLATSVQSFPTVSIRDLNLGTSSFPEASNSIPKVLRQTWLTTRLGRKHFRSRQAFLNLNSDFSVEFWNEAKANDYMRNNWSSSEIGEAYFRSVFGPLRADLFRYCITYERGGYYCDISKGISKPISSFVNEQDIELLSFERNPFELEISANVQPFIPFPNRVINYAFGFERNHQILKILLNQIVDDLPLYWDEIFSSPKEAIINLTGPVALTRATFKYIEQCAPQVRVNFAGIDFHNSGIFELPGSNFRYWKKASYYLAKPAGLFAKQSELS